MAKIKFKGLLDLGEKEILKFYPDLKPFLDEIKERGWSYAFTDIVGEAEAVLDLEKLSFRLHYYPPRIERFEEEGKYTIEAEIGASPPAMLKVLSVEEFKIRISSEHSWSAVKIDPQKKVITYIEGVLYDYLFSKEKTPQKLSEAREVYEIAKFLIEEKGFKPEDKYVVERYKELVDLFEKPYSFDISLELTVKNEDKVPGWREFLNQLSEFFYERGLLMKLKEEKKQFLPGKKPIP
ncbi:MAG: hypothetical protein DRJ37_00445 [Thermoprotei archaeon]|nr:MAG: hypothetical protein DRJ37_00445 [Thermoprotei archaeon]